MARFVADGLIDGASDEHPSHTQPREIPQLGEVQRTKTSATPDSTDPARFGLSSATSEGSHRSSGTSFVCYRM